MIFDGSFNDLSPSIITLDEKSPASVVMCIHAHKGMCMCMCAGACCMCVCVCVCVCMHLCIRSEPEVEDQGRNEEEC